MKKVLKSLKIVGNVFLWLFVAFSIIITMFVLTAQSNADGLPSFGGKYVINILSDSMSPTFKQGDLIIGQKLSNSEKLNLEVDDVITFYADLDGDGNTELNTHRIIEVVEDENLGRIDSYITKGDNKDTNQVADEPVKWDDIISKWNGKKIPFVGKFIGFLQRSQGGFFLIIVIPLLAFFIFELFRFVTTVKTMRSGEKKQITAADEELIKRKAVEEYLKSQGISPNEAETGFSTDDTGMDGTDINEVENDIDGDNINNSDIDSNNIE